MAITTTFLNDLWRVRIALSGLTDVDAVKIERALLTATEPWETVRGGVALPVVGGAAQLDDYEYGDAVLNHYRVTRVDPAPGLVLPDLSGSYASTPDHASLDIVGDIDLRVDVTLDDWADATLQVLLAKWTESGNQRSYRLGINLLGKLILSWSENGTNVISYLSTDPLDIGAGERLAVRATLDVDNGSGGTTVIFYTAPSIDGPWTVLETIPDPGTSSIHSGSAVLEVGSQNGGTASLAAGTVHAAVVVSDPFGTPVERANPDFAAEADGTTSFVDDAGRTWTVNGTAEILGDAVLETDSITPDNDGLTILKSIKYPALNRSLGEFPDFRPPQRSSRTGVYNIKGRVPPIAVHDAWTSQWWTMEFVTDTLAQARDIDLCITAGGTYFIQVPPETENECFTNPVSGMPGGYVYILNSTWHPAVHGSSVRSWVLPVRVVAPPSPEIIGSTITWETVKRLYGSWTALWAANPTWRDVWDQIMDPEDAIAL